MTRPGLLIAILLPTSLASGIAAGQSGQAGEPPLVSVLAGSDTRSLRRLRSYGKPNQTRHWYHSRAGRWDGVVPRYDGWWDGSDHYVVTDLAGAATFTGIELEDRDFGRPDVFWDDAAAMLYVLSSHPGRSEFWRLESDASGAYRLAVGDPGGGVGVPGLTHPETPLGGNSPASVYVDPGGTVWAAVMRERALLVQYSNDGGATWREQPVLLDGALGVGVTVWSHFVTDGVVHVGLFAGENGVPGHASGFHYWSIRQGADPRDPANWRSDARRLPPPAGREQADDHVSAARDAAGNLYFAVKTESGAPEDPLIKLFRRTPGGAWEQFAVTETRDVPEQSRPSLVIDEDRRVLHVYTNGAEIVGDRRRVAGRFTAPLDAPQALAGARFEPLLSAPQAVFTDVITPRHATGERSGTLVLAHNRTDDTVWFVFHPPRTAPASADE